jgi:hypothetical protein
MIGGPGYGRLRLANPKAGVGEFGRSTVREHGRECDPEWDEKWFLLHDLEPYAYQLAAVNRWTPCDRSLNAGLQVK